MSEIKKLTDLQPDSHNANRGTQRGVGMLDDSLRKRGAGRSIVLDRNLKIIAGNKTHQAAVDIGLEDVIIVKTRGDQLVAVQREDLDLDDPATGARELAYLDNRTSEVGLDWDASVIISDLELGLDLSGLWSPDELSVMLEGAADSLLGGDGNPTQDEEVDQTEAEKYQAIWQVKPGDVWQLGDHRIACLDSLDEEAVKAVIGGDSVGMVWADPPYGIDIVAANGYVGGGEAYDIPFGGGSRHKDLTGRYYIQEQKTRAKGFGSIDRAKPFGTEKPVRGSDGASNVVAVGKYAPVIGDTTTETAIKAVEFYLSLCGESCHIWWGGNYYTDALNPSPGWIVWDKDNTGNFADCELAWTNQKRAARIFKHRWNGMLKASEQGQRRVHPTQKPIALALECFREYGKPSDLIVDPFLGSGISVLAAEALGDRRVIGFELATEYIATTIQRFVNLGTGKDPIRLSE